MVDNDILSALQPGQIHSKQQDLEAYISEPQPPAMAKILNCNECSINQRADKKQEAFINLEHRGQYINPVKVSVFGKNGSIDHVFVFGPERRDTQVELSATDAFALGIDAPVRLSGDLGSAGSCELVGPAGRILAKETVIIPARHLHCSPEDALRLGVSNHDFVSVSAVGRTKQIIDHVSVRIHPTFSLSFHINSDESAKYWLTDQDHITML